MIRITDSPTFDRIHRRITRTWADCGLPLMRIALGVVSVKQLDFVHVLGRRAIEQFWRSRVKGGSLA